VLQALILDELERFGVKTVFLQAGRRTIRFTQMAEGDTSLQMD
jgi:hypothetical protein